MGVWAPVGNVLSGPEPGRKEWPQGGKQPQLVWTEKEGAATAGSWRSQALRPPQLPAPLPHGVGARKALTTHLGLIRLATTMMSLTLAEFFILAPEPMVMATSFSVKV